MSGSGLGSAETMLSELKLRVAKGTRLDAEGREI